MNPTLPVTAHSPLSRLLAPRSVAVIGASEDPLRIGGRPIAYMKSQGFKGRIMPVNPGRSTVQGLPAFASIADLPEVPDVAIIAVAATAVPQMVAELNARGVACGIVFSAGFAEIGGEGTVLQQAMMDAARSIDGRPAMRLMGPNSLGLVNPRNGFFGSFLSSVELGMPAPGRVAIISQSGAYGGHLLSAATKMGIGLSACVMTGNEADIALGDIVQMLVDDTETEVIALYSEGIRESSALVAALEAARQARKPVVMMKVGRSALGSAAAQSHTASIAGDDVVIDAVLSELGVVRAKTTEQMLDIVRLATRGVFPANNALGVMTVSGGAGVIISDAADDVGLPMPAMPESAQKALKAVLPFASPLNPVDITAQILNDFSLVSRFSEVMLSEGGYPSVLAFFTYTGGAPSVAPRLREQLKIVRDKYPERLFVLSVQASPQQIAEYEADGFSVFEDPTRAVVAIEAMGRFGRSFERREALPAPDMSAFMASGSLASAFRGAVAASPAVSLPSGTLSEVQAKRLLNEAGIASAPERLCATAEEAMQAASHFGWPVVLKIVSPDILHKSEIGGVLLNVASETAVREGFGTLLARAAQAVPGARIDGVLVAKQLKGGVECILGIHRDPVFGPMAMFGLGGIFVEVMKDVVFHRCPFGVDVAEQMICSIKGAPLLLGARGQPVTDVQALALMLSRLSAFAAAAGPQLQSADLNPVMVMPQGQGAFALDAVIVSESPA